MKKLYWVPVFALSITAIARGQSALGVADQFNVFTFGNATFSAGEAEGAVAVGGDLSINNSSNFTVKPGTAATVGTLSNIGVYVAGSVLDNSNGNVNNGTNILVAGNLSNLSPQDGQGSNVYYGGTISGLTNFQNNNHGHTFNEDLVDPSVFSTQQALSRQQSNLIAALTPAFTLNSSNIYNSSLAGVTTDGGNNVTINASDFSSGGSPVVIDILQSALVSDNRINLNIVNQGTTTFLFNIVDDNGSSYADFDWKTNDVAAYSLFNFATQTSVSDTNDAWYGSVLAAKADVSESHFIDGTVIADTFENNGAEVHWTSDQSGQFLGSIPVQSAVTPSAPGPAALSVFGVSAIGLFRRRKKA